MAELLQWGPAQYRAEVWDVMQLLFKSYNDHQIHAVISFNGRLNEGRLEKTVALTADAVPILKSRFVEHGFRAHWEEIPVGHFVSLCVTNNPEREVNRFLTDITDERVGPQVKIKIVRNPISDTVCILINHMVCDGAGFKEYLYLLSETYRALGGNPEYKENYRCSDRSMNQIYQACGSPVQLLKILATPHGMSKHDCGILFPLEGDRTNPFIVTKKLSRSRLQAIKAYGKTYGATVNDLILAAYVRALHRFLALEDGSIMTVPCTVDLRKYLPQRMTQGICNLTSTIACEVHLDARESYDETLKKVKRSMDQEKNSLSCLSGPLLLDILFRVIPYKYFKRLLEKVFVNPRIFLSNIGIIDKTKLNFGCSISNAYITGSIKFYPYFQLALTTFDDAITFSVGFHGSRNDKVRIGEFLSRVDSELPH